MSSVLYDHPGPRARRRNAVLTVVFAVVLAALLWVVYDRFDERGQWAADKWEPLVDWRIWKQFLIPGLVGTVQAAAVAMVFALAFGIVFAVGRLSEHWWISAPAGAVVEFFRAVPLLLMIFFVFYGMPWLIQGPVSAFWAVVIGLTLYNGSVLAEAFRAGVLAVPSGQSEAAYALGMRKNQVMQLILVPQAARAMLPVIVSQLVVLLKDTALGYIIAYPELLQRINEVNANFANVVPTALVGAAVFIAINAALTTLANWLDRRTSRRGLHEATEAAEAATGPRGMGAAGLG
ncbi:MAG TPA: amino acid ABC transporter permease [Micromonosporaceae bacterium]|nr:amino acid ABC transporter permease [Micromonosporaceae bacterium]